MEDEPVHNPPGMGSDITPCGVCGQSLDSTLILNQYGGACPYCLGYLTPEESPDATPAGEGEPADNPESKPRGFTPCGVCGRSVESTLVMNQFGGACPYCIGALVPEEGPAAAPTRPSPTGGEFGKYVLTERLGKGGMGEVWKALDSELRRAVALKFLHSEDPLELARFEREAHLAASLSHANIGAIHEIGVIDGRHYIAMQYVQGRTLEKYPTGDRRLMARLIRDASRAVEHAHRNG